jgi:hypothetical protein
MLLVLQVEDGRHRRRPAHRRQHHGQRKVQRVELVDVERAPKRAGSRRSHGHRGDPPRHRARGAVAVDDRRR